jgi:hypothetical protein
MEACRMPHLLFQIALIVMIVRSLFRAFKLFDHASKAWLDIVFHIAVAVVALSFLL